jgi:hypothetical protein
LIPPFDQTGFLPEGIYDCTMDEVGKRFGSFQRTGRRSQLWEKFIDFVREVEVCGLVEALLVDGSFATAKTEPNDIDLVVVVSSQHDFSAEFRPSAYNVLSKRRVHRRFGFDLLVARAGAEEYGRYLEFFQQVRLEPARKKGDTADMATISNEAQLRQAIEQIQVLCRAIDSLRADVFPQNPKNFAIMAEGPVDEIRKLQVDIDAYIQQLEATGTTASN